MTFNLAFIREEKQRRKVLRVGFCVQKITIVACLQRRAAGFLCLRQHRNRRWLHNHGCGSSGQCLHMRPAPVASIQDWHA